MTPARRRFRRFVLFGALGLFGLCLTVTLLSALSNRDLPTGPAVLDRLDPLDKARLQETLHLKQALGVVVWPGWGQADIPIILWNNRYSFLIGLANPPADWERVPDDDLAGQPYYRKPTVNSQNFAVSVAGQWVASMATKWETDNFLISQFRKMMPGPLKPVFPYRLLIQPSEAQISGVLHESFHVYQAEAAPSYFEDAENAYLDETRYWTADTAMHEAWATEINLLARAVEAKSSGEAAELAHQFLSQRDQRRAAHGLDAALVDYERRIEWLEGLAKYIELAIWREASASSDYAPLPVLTDDPDFKKYASFAQRWSQELDQMKRQATLEGDIRFYYTGMAQAMLLDQLMPGWKARALTESMTVEDLLREALQQPHPMVTASRARTRQRK